MTIEIPRCWRHADEEDALHFIIEDDEHQRHIKLKRRGNAALYDFIVASRQLSVAGRNESRET